MPTFNPRFQAGQVQGPGYIDSFMKGRAMALAYQTEKQQQQVRVEELSALMYGNTPEQRKLREDFTRAQIDSMSPKPVTPDFETFQTGTNVGILNTRTGQVRESQFPSKAPSSTSVSVSPGERRGTELRTEQLYDKKKTADSSIRSIKTIGKGMELLKEPMITGSFAEWRLPVEKFLTQAGFIDGKQVRNTEEFVAITAGEVGRVLSSGQFGSGTGLSDADREYAAKMAGGNINITKEGLEKILDMRRRVSLADIKSYNAELASMRQSQSEQVRQAGMTADFIDEPAVVLLSNPRPVGQGQEAELDWLDREYPGLPDKDFLELAARLGIMQ